MVCPLYGKDGEFCLWRVFLRGVVAQPGVQGRGTRRTAGKEKAGRLPRILVAPPTFGGSAELQPAPVVRSARELCEMSAYVRNCMCM